MSSLGPIEGTTSGVIAGNAGSATFVEQANRRPISWGAIFAGLIVALVVQLTLTVLGTSIGASTIDPADSGTPSAGQLGTGSGIWLGVSSLISIFAGAWVAGRLSGVARGIEAGIHGIIVWGITTLVTVWLLTTAIGAVLGGATSLLGSTINAGAHGIAAAAPGISKTVNQQLQANGVDANNIAATAGQQIQQTLRETGDPNLQPSTLAEKAKRAGNQAASTASNAAANPENGKNDVQTIIDRLRRDVNGTVSSADRTDLINVIQAKQHSTRAQATRTADQYIAQAKKAQRQVQQTTAQIQRDARQAGTAAATGVSRGSLAAFILLVLGAVVAALGAVLGAPAAFRRLPPAAPGVEYRSAAVR